MRQSFGKRRGENQREVTSQGCATHEFLLVSAPLKMKIKEVRWLMSRRRTRDTSWRAARTSRTFLSGSPGFLVTACAATVFVVAAAVIVPAKAQQLPHLNVDPVCRGIARHAGSPGERGGPDLSYRSCVANQLQVRKHLAPQWSGFSRAARANCIASTTAGGLPSYTELLTCLQIGQAATHMRASTGRTH